MRLTGQDSKRPWYTPRVAAVSLYLHIPFCRQKCSYCDFNTYAGQDDLIPAYVSALRREIYLFARAASAAGETIVLKSIFFGGGTPSRLPAHEMDNIFSTIQSNFDLDPEAEITLEANPGGLSIDHLRALRLIGVNRLSLGMQTARPHELSLLGRDHDYFDVLQAVRDGRKAGFDNLNLDLIFNLPYQTLTDWQKSLTLALSLDPDHFSLYALTLEHGTPLGHWAQKGLIEQPDPDLGADMYLWAGEWLKSAGFEQYEISNWGRIDGGSVRTCRHNLQYWRNEPYIGLGAGAHGFIGGSRTVNVLSPSAYIRRSKEGTPQDFPRTPATVEMIGVDPLTEMKETMLMGLRLTQEGVSRVRFFGRFGQELETVFGEQIGSLRDKGLVEWAGPRGETLRLTKKGRLLGNQVFIEFV